MKQANMLKTELTEYKIVSYFLLAIIIFLIFILILSPESNQMQNAINNTIENTTYVDYVYAMKEYSSIDSINTFSIDNKTSVNIVALFDSDETYLRRLLDFVDFSLFERYNIRTIIITNSTLSELKNINNPEENYTINGMELNYRNNPIIFIKYDEEFLPRLCHELAHVILNSDGITDDKITEPFAKSYGENLRCLKLP